MSMRIATRRSPLALWQAEYVADQLKNAFPEMTVELVPMTTQGDQILNQPLAEIGGKGLFIKELEVALLENRADIAVHSMKDVPAELPPGFEVGAMLERADPRDALVALNSQRLDDLTQNARLGTASLRRQAQLLAHRGDLQISAIRGNVQTRLRKLDDGDYDAIVLAAAGLERLGLEHRISGFIDSDVCLPAIGQGVVGVECRQGDTETLNRLASIQHTISTQAVTAERAFGLALGGDCQSPIAGFATIADNELWLRGLVATADGKKVLRDQIKGDPALAHDLGTKLGQQLLDQGAEAILRG